MIFFEDWNIKWKIETKVSSRYENDGKTASSYHEQ